MSEIIRNNWSLEDLVAEATTRGKKFETSPTFLNFFLAPDLEAGATILFSEADVKAAIEEGVAAPEWEDFLLDLVSETGRNTFAVIRAGFLERWQNSNQRWIEDGCLYAK